VVIFGKHAIITLVDVLVYKKHCYL